MQTQIPAQEVRQNRSAAKHESAQPQFEDARAAAAIQMQLQSLMDGSAQTQHLKTMQSMMAVNVPVKVREKNSATNSIPLQRMEEDEAKIDAPAQREKKETEPSPQTPNNTGLPISLKTGIENLSGMSMDHVRVHYNSDKPAQLQAHAYAQGNEIHVAPGQEQHLPHEAWHVVQQAQGRVKPTMQMKAGVNVNDDKGLEAEADIMGAKAISVEQKTTQKMQSRNTLSNASLSTQKVAQRAELATDKLNVAGENHDESGARRGDETAYSTAVTGGGYWREGGFTVSDVSDEPADAFVLRAKQLVAFAKKANFSKWLDMDTNALVSGLITKAIDGTIFENSVRLFRPKELEIYKGYMPPEVYREFNDTLLTNSDVYERCIANIKISLDEYTKTKSTQAKDSLVEWVTSFQLLLGIMSMQINQVTEALDIISVEDVCRQRSQKMHDAANNRSGTMGLWKIGDDHATDMLAMNPKTYNHLSRTDFNTGFDLFVARRAALVKITTLANGNWGPYTKGISSRPTGVSAIRDIISGAGNLSTKAILTSIKVRATTDSTRNSSNRHQKTTDFYAALSAMNVDNLVSLKAIPGLMDAINL